MEAALGPGQATSIVAAHMPYFSHTHTHTHVASKYTIYTSLQLALDVDVPHAKSKITKIQNENKTPRKLKKTKENIC